MTHDRSLAEPAFPDDDGTAAAALVGAFGDDTAVLAVLGGVRIFVPVVALPADAPANGDNPPQAGGAPSGEMAAVLMTGADGRTGLLVFSSVDAMTAWDPAARPVPVWGHDAARAALDEQASAILLDLGGPSFTVIESADVEHVAAGHRLVATEAGPAWLT